MALRAVEFLAEVETPGSSDARVYRFLRNFAVRGTSARFGEEIAMMLARGEHNLANFLLDEIRRRPSHEDPETFDASCSAEEFA